MPEPRNIVMMGDLLRTERNNLYHGDRMARCLYELFHRQIEDVTGTAVHLELAGDGRRFDRDRFYAVSGISRPSPEGWLRVASTPCPPRALDYIGHCFANTLVLCHEADSLLPILELAGIPYIDIRIAPIRFLPDLHLAFRSNVPEVRERLLSYRVPEEHIRYHAGRIKAGQILAAAPARIAARCAVAGLPPGSLLICGQIDLDLSLLRDGRIVRLEECSEALDRVLASHPAAFFKPHPYARNGGSAGRFIRTRPGVRRTDQNIYRLLSDDNLETVAALSSGVLSEAPYFGKKIHVLSHRYVHLATGPDAARPEEYTMTRDDYHSPHFWADILAPCVACREGVAPGPLGRANLLRETLGLWWGYDRGGGTAKTPATLRLLRRIADFLDPDHVLRTRLDPSGARRHKLKNRLR